MVESYGKYKAAAKAAAQPQMPVGLCYIASMLESKGHNVSLIDCDSEDYSVFDVVDRVKKINPAAVGLTAATPIFQNAKKIIDLIKSNDEKIITILGGFHLTALPIQTMEICKADYGVYGEGDETICELINKLEKKKSVSKVRGILYRKKGKVIINPPRPQIKNLDKIPFPARPLLKQEKYLWSVPGKGLVPVTSIITARGCPFNCIFCGVKTMFKGVRFRSLNNIMDEIEHIVNGLKITHIMIQDDTLTLDVNKMKKFCQEIEKRKLKFTWEGFTRANTITKELLATMKKAGLVRVSFGVESGNPKILRAIKKGVELEDYKRAYKWCNELGIETLCLLMLGHPFETKETIKETMEFANSLDCYQAYISITIPYPGCELFDLAKKGYGGINLLTTNWGEYRRYGNAVMEMNDLSTEDLIKMQKWAFKKFYLRPKIIWYNFIRAGPKAFLINGWAFFKSVFL